MRKLIEILAENYLFSYIVAYTSLVATDPYTQHKLFCFCDKYWYIV